MFQDKLIHYEFYWVKGADQFFYCKTVQIVRLKERQAGAFLSHELVGSMERRYTLK